MSLLLPTSQDRTSQSSSKVSVERNPTNLCRTSTSEITLRAPSIVAAAAAAAITAIKRRSTSLIMCAFLVKRISSFLFSSHSHPPHHYHRHLPLLLRLTLSTHSQSQFLKDEDIPFVSRYLISSFGFSRDRALKVSRCTNLAAIKSSARPDSVICFLTDIGLSDSQIKAAISFHPRLISYNVDKTMKPQAREIVAAGFTGETLVQLIRYSPTALAMKNPVLGLRFWREFLGNDDEALLKVIRRNRLLFTCDIDGSIVPKLNLLREYGLSNQHIMTLLLRGFQLMPRSLDYIRWVLEKTQVLGLEPGSKMFLVGIIAVGKCTQSTFNRKIELFKRSYGWSDNEVYSAFRKFPTTLTFSVERIKSHMDFLIGKAMLDPRSIASRPVLLGYSMERNLVPRLHVLTILKAHGLKKHYKLNTACRLSEKRFLENCVVPHEKDVPGLAEAYAAACSGMVPH